jgi:hypothetical protein
MTPSIGNNGTTIVRAKGERPVIAPKSQIEGAILASNGLSEVKLDCHHKTEVKLEYSTYP